MFLPHREMTKELFNPGERTLIYDWFKNNFKINVYANFLVMLWIKILREKCHIDNNYKTIYIQIRLKPI